MFYVSNLLVWWLVVATLGRTCNTSGNHPLRFPLLPPFRDRWGKGIVGASVGNLGKTFLSLAHTSFNPPYR
tara:strand:- start:2758 stop:2970 length:213 start_codon:yes stop_codon:yes gene_type:complete